MGVKRLWVKVQGNLYDMWHIVSAEKEDEYNEKRQDLDYKIVLNKTVVSRDIREMVFTYTTAEARDADMAELEQALRNSPRFVFIDQLGEDDFKESEDLPDFDQ